MSIFNAPNALGMMTGTDGITEAAAGLGAVNRSTRVGPGMARVPPPPMATARRGAAPRCSCSGLGESTPRRAPLLQEGAAPSTTNYTPRVVPTRVSDFSTLFNAVTFTPKDDGGSQATSPGGGQTPPVELVMQEQGGGIPWAYVAGGAVVLGAAVWYILK